MQIKQINISIPYHCYFDMVNKIDNNIGIIVEIGMLQSQIWAIKLSNWWHSQIVPWIASLQLILKLVALDILSQLYPYEH